MKKSNVIFGFVIAIIPIFTIVFILRLAMGFTTDNNFALKLIMNLPDGFALYKDEIVNVNEVIDKLNKYDFEKFNKLPGFINMSYYANRIVDFVSFFENVGHVISNFFTGIGDFFNTAFDFLGVFFSVIGHCIYLVITLIASPFIYLAYIVQVVFSPNPF